MFPQFRVFNPISLYHHDDREWRNSLLQCQSVYFLKRLNFFLRSSAWHGFISPCPCTVLSSSGRVVGSLVSDRIRHRTRQGSEDSPHCYHRRRWQPATLNSLLTCNYADTKDAICNTKDERIRHNAQSANALNMQEVYAHMHAHTNTLE